MSKGTKYDPKNIQQYFGKQFLTEHSSYALTKEGKFIGRPHLEGSEIKLIAGIDPKEYANIFHCLYISRPDLKEKLENIILKEGQEIKPGLMLVISLTSKYVSLTGRNGFITSRVEKIEEYKKN